MLQFITGKEYTFVLEIFVDESAVKPEDILLEVNFIYDEILSKNQNKLNVKYKYELKDLKFAKANDEYVRSQTYDVLDRVLKLNEDNKSEEAKKLLNEMKVWIEKNYKDEYKSYLEDIKKSEQIFEFGFNARRGVTTTISMVSQNMSKRMGSNNMYSNSVQMRLQDNYRNSYTQKIMSNKNNNFV
jgi:hypothetical protein